MQTPIAETTRTRKVDGAPRGVIVVRILTAALFFIAALVILAGPARGQTDASSEDSLQRLVLRPESRLWLEGSSNVHDWSCEAGAITAEIQVRTQDPASATTPALPRTVERVVVTVPVEAIDCGNGKMNDNLRKALQAEDHPTIEFRMDEYALAEPAEPADEAGTPARLVVESSGTLTIAGTSRTIELVANGEDSGDGGLRITGSYELLMTDFGVKPPTAMLGLLKTDDTVAVHFDLVTSFEELAGHLGTTRERVAATVNGTL